MTQNQTLDHEKAANIRQLLDAQNEKAVSHRYGEQVLNTQEFQRAKQGLAKSRQAQKQRSEQAAEEQQLEADAQQQQQQEQEVQQEQEAQQQRQVDHEVQQQAELEAQQEQERADEQQQEQAAEQDEHQQQSQEVERGGEHGQPTQTYTQMRLEAGKARLREDKINIYERDQSLELSKSMSR